jgi:branched-chain amino acid transport system substrate-binding protein
MLLRYWIAAGVGLLLVGVGVAWALRSDAEDELTIYASLPLQGTLRGRSADMDRGMRLALKQAGNRAGDFKIRYQLLDDSSPEEGGWTQEAVARNATRAADDPHTAVYLGEFNSGATSVSILILSGDHVPQISAGSTKVGLTSNAAGAGSSEPDRYYQNGYRNFVRVVPNDTVQGDALVAIMQADGCRRVGMLNDQEPYGSGLANNIRDSAHDSDLSIVFDEALDKTATDARARAGRAARDRVDCFVYSGDAGPGAKEVYNAMAAALPTSARFYGGDGVSDTNFTDAQLGGLAAPIASRLQLTIPALGERGLEAGQKFFTDFQNAYPDHTNPDPYAIYAYESMLLALDAIKRSGSGEREDIVKALFATRNRPSVLGRYSIDSNGDTTVTDYGRFDIEDGKPRFRRTIETSLKRSS